MDNFTLGEWYEFTETTHKRHRNNKTIWATLPLSQPKRGMYIGWRIVKEGDCDGEWISDGEWVSTFTPTNHIKVLLFITNERQNPIYVRADSMLNCQGLVDGSEMRRERDGHL